MFYTSNNPFLPKINSGPENYSFENLLVRYIGWFLWKSVSWLEIRDKHFHCVFDTDFISLIYLLRYSSFFRFVYFIDYTAFEDETGEISPFLILCSPLMNIRLVLKSYTQDQQHWISLTAVYPGINWSEREVYDMYGITFKNHPSLRRILMDYGITFFPLRKTCPTSGPEELYYNPSTHLTSYRSVSQISEERASLYKSIFYYPIEFTTISLVAIDFYKEFTYLITFFTFFSSILCILLFVSYVLTTFLRGVDFFSSKWYECGFDSLGVTRGVYDIRFFRVVILFILYDLELLYLLPWIIMILKVEGGVVLYSLLFFYFLFLIILVFAVEIGWSVLQLDEKKHSW